MYIITEYFFYVFALHIFFKQYYWRTHIRQINCVYTYIIIIIWYLPISIRGTVVPKHVLYIYYISIEFWRSFTSSILTEVFFTLFYTYINIRIRICIWYIYLPFIYVFFFFSRESKIHFVDLHHYSQSNKATIRWCIMYWCVQSDRWGRVCYTLFYLHSRHFIMFSAV